MMLNQLLGLVQKPVNRAKETAMAEAMRKALERKVHPADRDDRLFDDPLAYETRH